MEDKDLYEVCGEMLLASKPFTIAVRSDYKHFEAAKRCLSPLICGRFARGSPLRAWIDAYRVGDLIGLWTQAKAAGYLIKVDEETTGMRVQFTPISK